MKKPLALVLVLCLSVTLTGCMGSSIGATSKRSSVIEVFQVSDYPIWVTTPNNWEETYADNLDLQVTDPGGDIYLSAYGYTPLDLAEGQTPQELFEMQNDSLLTLREYPDEIEPLTVTEDEEKFIYATLYSAEWEGAKNYYHFFLVEFKATGDMAWILVNGIPSDIQRKQKTIKEMVSKVQNTDPRQTI